MQIGNQIRDLRNKNNLSQEELALKIFVSRQSVSNWENDKTYPDLKSLLLLSKLFEVSLDSLIKGDLEVMKKHIEGNELKRFYKESTIFTVLLVLMLVTPIPLQYFLGDLGNIIWCIITVLGIAYAFKVEKLKKKHNVYTYKEIVALTDNKSLSHDEILEEKGKRKYQPYFYMMISAILAVVVAFAMDFAFSTIFG